SALARRVLGMTVCVMAILLAGSGCTRAPELRPLTVVGWGGSSQDALRRAYWNSFTSATGIQIREDSRQVGINVLRGQAPAHDGGWDVVQVETEELIAGCAEGLFEPLDWASLGGRDAFFEAAVH